MGFKHHTNYILLDNKSAQLHTGIRFGETPLYVSLMNLHKREWAILSDLSPENKPTLMQRMYLPDTVLLYTPDQLTWLLTDIMGQSSYPIGLKQELFDLRRTTQSLGDGITAAYIAYNKLAVKLTTLAVFLIKLSLMGFFKLKVSPTSRYERKEQVAA